MVAGRVLGFYQAFGVGGKKFRFDPERPKERSRALKLANDRELELRQRHEETRRNRRSKK